MMRLRSGAVVTGLAGVDPELVLVLEIISDVADFYKAVRGTPGLEFLAGMDESDITDLEEYFGEDVPDAPLDGTLFMVATNQQALEQVLGLWRRFKERPSEPWPRGFTNWRNVFDLLLDVRTWGPRDRLRNTGALQDFAARAQACAEVVPAELELWFRENPLRRTANEREVADAVAACGGVLIAKAEIPEIRYHGLLVELPIAEITALLADGPDHVAVLNAEGIAFVRPEAQAMAILEPVEDEGSAAAAVPQVAESESQQPLVGVLDGLPIAQHVLLAGRLELDDPDDLGSTVPAGSRQHGTTVTSLVLHGDLSAPSPGPSRVYVRPILEPLGHWDGSTVERMPARRLPADVFHEAVRRMVDPDYPGGPVAQTVRIINVSIGDSSRPLDVTVSAWARLLDWLSYKYRVLFVVSAGNHNRDVTLSMTLAEFSALDPAEQRDCVLRWLALDSPHQRLLSPAEAVNALTVAASHDDASGTVSRGSLVDILPKSASGAAAHPGIYCSRGAGYKRSIKPDVLAPGGRMLYREDFAAAQGKAQLRPAAPVGSLPPGIRSAMPTDSGGLTTEGFCCGTSMSAAIVTHDAGILAERLVEAPYDVPPEYLASLVKAMVVHTCALGDGANELRNSWPSPNPHRIRDDVGRFFGYGVVQPSRMIGGSAQRVTLFGFGDVEANQGLVYRVPLPPSLSGVVTPRTVAITLASLLPVRSTDRRYREVEVYFMPEPDVLGLQRADSSRHAVRRGSVQHEVLTGSAAVAFVDGDELSITVSCRSIIESQFRGKIPFGLVVTVEAEGLPIYLEVAQRVAQIRAQARARQRV